MPQIQTVLDDRVQSPSENCPHQLVEPGARLVVAEVALDSENLLALHTNNTHAAPAARFVVTSRDGLRLRGESVVALPPLETQQAAELFMATAQRVRASFTVSDGEAAALEALVKRLDGIPLAVELAAARATVMSPQRMLDRIDLSYRD